MVPGVDKLNAGQGSVAMDGFDHELQSGDILIAPEPPFNIRHEIGGVVDFNLLGTNNTPTAFRFHAAHGGHGAGHTVAEAIAVGHLVEAIRGHDRADGYGLEQDVEGILAWIAHDYPPTDYADDVINSRSFNLPASQAQDR